ncbi:hypothetical protein UFOVP141_46 [uncultured Caudovirales phage]|uniref:Uncharacterized protein n=1 Tax=uncultured Caudovirales phage TaxID=2100421 RepID=A0A6J7VPR5_9CAUD|nr:hypothetical protein UFOVP141_46 [uncultured Caudovirales phage]
MSLCSCDFEPATVYREVERRANRDHRCSDCGGVIRRRERYKNIASLFDGSWLTAKRCADCQHMVHEVERAFMEGCGGKWCLYIGDLPISWEEIADNVAHADAEVTRQIVAMQHAACEARGGNRKWHLPVRFEKEEG